MQPFTTFVVVLLHPTQKTDKIVYIDGAWDLFHIGHIKVLQKAKELGDFLIVGVVDDKVLPGGLLWCVVEEKTESFP